MEYYLKSLGYQFVRNFHYEHSSVIAAGWSRSVRIDSLGAQYSRESIDKKMLEGPGMHRPSYPDWKRKPLLSIEYELRRLEKMDTVALLFQIFTELLKICTGSNIDTRNTEPLSPMVRAEVKKLDTYLEEYHFLCENKIQTAEELMSFHENLTAQIDALEQKRYALRLKLRRVKTPEDEITLKEQCKEITKELTPLRKALTVVQRIEAHTPKIRELLDTERQIERKHNGFIKQKEGGYER